MTPYPFRALISSLRRVLPSRGSLQGKALSFICLLFILMAPAAVSAQDTAQLIVSSPELKKFPQVSLYLDAQDSTGAALQDLKPDDLQVLEDGLARPVDSLEQIEPGLQVIVALNAGPVMANRSGSDTQFDRIRQILEDWAQARANNGQDDYSLAGNTGLQSIRLTDPQKFASILQGYKPDLLKLQPNITSLSQALDLATDPNPRPQMKRAILYITSLPSTTSLAALPNLTDRAAQLGVRVFVWSVGPNAGAKNSSSRDWMPCMN